MFIGEDTKLWQLTFILSEIHKHLFCNEPFSLMFSVYVVFMFVVFFDIRLFALPLCDSTKAACHFDKINMMSRDFTSPELCIRTITMIVNLKCIETFN